MPTASPPAGADAETARRDSRDAGPVPLVVSALRQGPRTGFELARHVERVWPGYLKEREGYLYPFLLELWRQGRIEASWGDRPAGRRRVYRLSGTPAPAPDASHAVDTPPAARGSAWSPRLETIAAACTRFLAFAPRLQAELHAEILGHLDDATAAYQDLGRKRDDAESAAIDDLGDPWRIRTDLRRAAQGRRTVVFPRDWIESVRGIAIYDLRILLVIMAGILFVRFQVVTAYHIPTRSMEPTLHGDPEDGDRILVNKWSGAVKRFEIVVFDGWEDERKNFVKRCVGLPGELVEIFAGNLWIDGQLVRKRGADYEAMLFPVFRMQGEIAYAKRGARDDPAEALRAQLENRFQKETGSWKLATAGAGDGTLDAAWLDGRAELDRWAEVLFDDSGAIRDGVWDPHEATSEGGREFVADLRAEVELLATEPGTRAGIRLTRGPDTYDCLVANDGRGLEVLVNGQLQEALPDIDLADRGALRLAFSQVDLVLRVTVDGETVYEHDLPAPSFPASENPRGEVRFLVASGAARIAPVAIDRDIHWTSGDYDDRTRIQLGEDEYCMLGDNSGNSQDSRARGPVHGTRLVGKPLLVVWPPARMFHVPR